LAKSENFAASVRLRSALVKSAIHVPSSDHEPAGPVVHTTFRPTLTQTQRLRERRYGRDREFLRLLCAGHGGPWQKSQPSRCPANKTCGSKH
jgi:hypothetical protein